MPIYDFKCEKCQKITEAIAPIVYSGQQYITCECGYIAYRIFSGTHFIPFKPYIETNLGDEPVEIKSKKELRKECNKVGADYV